MINTENLVASPLVDSESRKAWVIATVEQQLKGRHRVIVIAATNRAREALDAGHTAHRAICRAMDTVRPALVYHPGHA